MKLIYITFLLISFKIFATSVPQNNCEHEIFIPYKSGVYAEKNGQLESAFDIYCNLAFKGDYRAQNKLAKFYYKGIPNYLEQDLVQSYIWAGLSNRIVKTKKKSLFIEELKNILDEEKLNIAHNNLVKAVRLIPTGERIDMSYKPMDLNQINKILKKQRSKSYTGTRIKSDKKPEHLKLN